jgi:phosphatidyl-myo-inositol alpha-mannosyltransferase
MRVAIISYKLPSPGRKSGGIERVAHCLADGLAQRGHRVTVFTYDTDIEGARYKVQGLPLGGLWKNWLGQRVTMGYLGNVITLCGKYNEFDVIVAHGDSLLLPLRAKPVVRVMHGSALGEALSADSPWRFLLQLGVYCQELITGLFQRNCVAVSQNTRSYNPFIRHVISNGVDLSVFYPVPECKTPEPSVAYVGVLGGRKRGMLLLKWFAREVLVRHPTAKLMVVGDSGPRIPGVIFLTGVSDTELAAVYRRAWVYASPSTYEGFGLPSLEAMASGTPVVATPNPGSRELLGDGRYGLLVQDGEFGMTLAELLADSEARQRLARLGLDRAQDYSLKLTIDRYEALLSEVCNRNLGVGR